MTGGSLGLRSGSYGSLQLQVQNGVSPIQATPPLGRKPAKMLKEKERLFHWLVKFAGRKKVGMLLLCAISAAVFIWVLYVGKGEDAHDVESLRHIRVNSTFSLTYPESSPFDRIHGKWDHSKFFFKTIVENASLPDQPPMRTFDPPPPALFLGYNLPPEHPCATFTFPPPPTDKKRTGPRPCPVCYLSVEEAITFMPKGPSSSPVVANLTYIRGENFTKSEFGGSEFGGYPSLKQRSDSYNIKESMSVHCGFVKGERPGRDTGFDMNDADLLEMEQCHGVVVASAIFGNYDVIQQPKNISDTAKQNVCFFMFVDEETKTSLEKLSGLNNSNKVGLWRIVLVRNLPYADARRNGKVPKLLLHRIFPNARYSVWIDGKLELVVDPYQVLERFLWRQNTTFAISRHYRRFDVFEEAEANKAARKYDNTSIDFQIKFYKNEGLSPYSSAKLPITSDVPEGCVIIREHTPLTNLFTCLWFNEVDRFTSRDQLSFSTVRDKILSKVDWSVNMFMDCERRNFVVQAYHRDLLEHMTPITILPPPLPPPQSIPPTRRSKPELSSEKTVPPPSRRVVARRGRDKKRHRKVAAGSRDVL